MKGAAGGALSGLAGAVGGPAVRVCGRLRGSRAQSAITVLLRQVWGGSSAGQSSGLIIRRSWVRSPAAPPAVSPTSGHSVRRARRRGAAAALGRHLDRDVQGDRSYLARDAELAYAGNVHVAEGRTVAGVKPGGDVGLRYGWG